MQLNFSETSIVHQMWLPKLSLQSVSEPQVKALPFLETQEIRTSVQAFRELNFLINVASLIVARWLLVDVHIIPSHIFLSPHITFF